LSRSLRSPGWPLRVGVVLGALGLGIATILVTGEQALLSVLGLSVALIALSTLVARPELGVLVFVALLYANAPVNLGRLAANAQVIGIAVTGLIAVSVLVEVYVRRQGWVFDYTFMGIVGFTAVALCSTLLSRYPQTSVAWTVTLLTEGVSVYLLVVNAVRRFSTLKRVIWVLLCVCAFTSALSAYQELTGSYTQDFYGLARRNMERGLGDRASEGDGLLRNRTALYSVYRAQGPIGDPNRFGQALIVVIPFGLLAAARARAASERLLAAALSAAILGGMFLTYSRSTMLMLGLVVVLMVLLDCLRVRHVVLAVLTTTLLVSVVAPGTVRRLSSIRGVEGILAADSETAADGAIRGRTTAMLAALNTFRDHPLFGVGPGSYTPHYSVDYMTDPEVAFRDRTTPRRAHSLYLELAAEVGIIGLLAFLAVPVWLAMRLWFLRRYWMPRDRERGMLAGAFLVALAAYFGTALFLHLSYQRYFWLLMGLAGAAVHLLSPRPGAHTKAADVAPLD